MLEFEGDWDTNVHSIGRRDWARFSDNLLPIGWLEVTFRNRQQINELIRARTLADMVSLVQLLTRDHRFSSGTRDFEVFLACPSTFHKSDIV
jgi:hypothetical protein